MPQARDRFTGEFDSLPAEAKAYLGNASYVDTLKKTSAGTVRETLQRLQKFFVEQRPRDFAHCVAYARLLFEEQYANIIKQLTHLFPRDAKTKEGADFWSAPKRFPTALEFDTARLAVISRPALCGAHS